MHRRSSGGRMREHGIWVALALAVLLFAVLLFNRDAAARYAWSAWQNATLAIALDRSDASLAMDIGNDFFGAVPLGDSQTEYDPALAARAFKKALSIQPGILWAHYSLARIDFANGDFGAALNEANAELAANPHNVRTLYVRGLIYGYRNLPGDLSLAEDDLLAFTKWAPTEWAGYNDLAWILLREGKYQETLSALAVAFKEVPEAQENPWLLNDRGLAYLDLGDTKDAAIDFTAALARARALTEANWRSAYSGDAPSNDAEGLAAFRSGIADNLAKTSKAP